LQNIRRFEFRNEKDSILDFMIHKDGTVTDIDIELTFQNKKKINSSNKGIHTQ
jgi:hypothetical protein